MKRIGVLTSGGDAPGMNAAIRAVIRTGLHYGMEVYGIREGYKGLMEGNMEQMFYRSASDIIGRGGTILKTARCLEFATPEGVKQAVQNAKDAGLEGIVVIGGDGSFRGARDLSINGLPTIGIPGTIDNDIACTEYTIGFDTAMNTACEAIDKLKDTCASHNRCSVVEVMGRHAGHIALQVGIASGAESIIVPEKDFDLQKDIISRIEKADDKGKSHFIVLVAEGVGHAYSLAKNIEEVTGVETRATILGHIQRGGSPSVRDRVMATQMGVKAVELLREGIGNRVIAYHQNEMVHFDITEALEMSKSLEDNLLHASMVVTE